MEPEKNINGALVGLIIIVIILIVGAVYIWQSNKADQARQIQSEKASEQDSRELDTLDADINKTDTSTGVDAEAVY